MRSTKQKQIEQHKLSKVSESIQKQVRAYTSKQTQVKEIKGKEK